MATTLQINFHGIDHSPAVADQIAEELVRLERSFPSLISCRATIDQPHRHHRHGNLFSVNLDLSLPGSEVVVNQDAEADAHVAVHAAFRSAERQLRGLGRGGRRRAQLYRRNRNVGPASRPSTGIES